MNVIELLKNPSYDTPEGKMTPLLVNKNLSVIHLELPAGMEVTPHSHPHEGIFMLISGSVSLVGDEPKEMKEGDIAVIPPGYPVGINSHSSSKAVLLSASARYESIEELQDRLNQLFNQSSS